MERYIVAYPRGGTCASLPGPISFIFMQFSVKILPNNRLVPIFGVGASPSRLGNPGSTTAKCVLLVVPNHLKFDVPLEFKKKCSEADSGLFVWGGVAIRHREGSNPFWPLF